MFGWTAANRRKAERMPDAISAYDGGATGVMSGIIAGTRVATEMGWRDVAALQAGDLVLTFDGGLQRVSAIERKPMWSGRGACPEAFWPLHVPAGALENAKPMRVLPRQGVMLESDLAEDVLGDPFALIPAAVLEGLRGIERVRPNDRIDVVTLHFEADQVVFAEHGALLFCPAGRDLVQMAVRGLASLCRYEMLPEACAVQLVRGVDAREEEYRCQEDLRAAYEGYRRGNLAVA